MGRKPTRVYGLRCEQCGAEFSRVPSQLALGMRLFCSLKCCGQSKSGIPRKGGGLVARPFVQNYIEEPNSGCFLWLGFVNEAKPNYPQAMAVHNGRPIPAARRSWLLHHGPIGDGLCVCHTCDNPMCVNPDHLFLGTRRDNTQDMIRKGRQRAPGDTPRGEAHPRAKLNEDLVRKIRALAGRSAPQIAEDLGISVHNVRNVLRRTVWEHVS
jgi:hypothetical protein